MAKKYAQCSVQAGYSLGKTILVVDDEAVIRDLLKRTLLREGFKVVTATDGIEGLKHLESGGVEIVISDIVMPKMGGMELLEKVKADFPQIPVILITGQAYKAESKHAPVSGAEAYIVKPFKNQDIRFALQRTMLKLK